MGTLSVELDAILAHRLQKTEPDHLKGDDGSITDRLNRAASPLKKKASEIKALVNKNMSLEQELQKQQQKHEEDLQVLKQQLKERDDETQKQMEDLQKTLTQMQARFEYDLHFDMLNDMPREKAVKVCELIESLEKERSAIRHGEERNAERFTASPFPNGIHRCDSFHLVGASPTPRQNEMTMIWQTIPEIPSPPAEKASSAGDTRTSNSDAQENMSICVSALESSDDEDTAVGKNKSAFQLSFNQEYVFTSMFQSLPRSKSFDTLVVSALPGHEANLKDVVKLTRAITQVLDRTDVTEFVAIYDMRDLRAPSAPVVLEIANWCRVNEHRFRRRLRAAAIIMAGDIWTKAISACVWAVTCIAPPVCPFQMVSSEEEADAFLKAQLEALEARKQLKEERRQSRRKKADTGSTEQLEVEDDEGCSSVGGSRRGSTC